MSEQKFDLWCVVELFGHTKIAGRCTEQNIAGTNMLRVDVPETEKQPAFTRFFGSSAIYAINPMDEESVKRMASRLQQEPIHSWNVSELVKKHQSLLTAAPAESAEEDPDRFEEDDDDDDDDNGGDKILTDW